MSPSDHPAPSPAGRLRLPDAKPVRLNQVTRVRRKLAALSLSKRDVTEAVAWAWRKAAKPT